MNVDQWGELISRICETVDRVHAANPVPKSIQTKEALDYVSQLDLQCQDETVALLADLCPGHTVLGEEGVGDTIGFEGGDTWLVDPLDGTSNFVFGIPFYSYSIALVSHGKVTAALVYDPLRKEVFEALAGSGARMNGRPLVARENRSDFVAVSSGAMLSLAESAPNLIVRLREKSKFRLLGSQALQLCYVAAGRLQACISREAKLWDDIAGAFVVEEAGAVYRNRAGVEMTNLAILSAQTNMRSVAAASYDQLYSDVLEFL